MRNIIYIKYQSRGWSNFEGVNDSFVEEVTRILRMNSDLPDGQRDSS